MTSLRGMDAKFHCACSGPHLRWEVDGLPNNDQSILDRGITESTIVSSGTVQSNLTVPATEENNGTIIRCLVGLSLSSLEVVGNYSTLTIIPGLLLHAIMNVLSLPRGNDM